MKQIRTPSNARVPSWMAAAALLLPLAGCDSGSTAAPASPSLPPPPPAQSQRQPVQTPMPETKPAPVPLAQSVPQPAPNSEPKPDPKPAPEPVTKPTDVSVSGFETGSAVGSDGHVTDPKTVFAASDIVHLAVIADGAARKVNLSVTWLGPDGARITEDQQEAMLGAPTALDFTLASVTGLALGSYKAEIRIEGWLASTAAFEVR